MKRIAFVCFIFHFFAVSDFVAAQDNNAKVVSTKLVENIYRFELNDIVNVVAFIGPDGVLLVDAGYDKNLANGFVNSPNAIKEELKRLGNTNIKYIIDTHTDFDHAYGNTELGHGATIISHRLGRERLSSIVQFPKEGLPNLTFQDSITVYFNSEQIDLFYLPGHTDHDIVIHFKNAKIVCIGDLIIPDSFGSISQTGNVYSMIKAIDYLYNHFNDDITFVAGHDRTMKRDYLKTYKNMIEKTLSIVVDAINKGQSIEEMQKDDILKDWKSWNGVLFKELDANMWISMIYMNIITSLKPSVAGKIAELLKNMDFVTSYSKIRSLITQKEEYFFLEREFNFLGYNLINEGRLKDAIGIFKITVELYPESWNAYDSLGEAYMKAGNNKLAIENYEKSIVLNPQNTNAIEVVKKLKELK